LEQDGLVQSPEGALSFRDKATPHAALDSSSAAHYRRCVFLAATRMRPRFLGTKHHPRIVGGSSATQRFRAARARARTSGRSTIRVDLDSVVSKYIGQTERNLDRLLDEAQQANAVLFIDEADDLFGRDTEDGNLRTRLAAAKQYLRAGARRRRLSLVMGKPLPAART
jgi:hypothetical protein